MSRQRITLAKELLLQGEKLSHLAERTGHFDRTALSRAFKKATGIPPAWFRRRSPRG